MARITKATAHSVFLHALKTLAGKAAEQVRDELSDGSAHDYELRLSGKVDGYAFNEQHRGTLRVDHARDESMPCDLHRLLALALEAMPGNTAEGFMANLERFTSENGELPPVSDEAFAMVSALRSKHRYGQKHKRGAITAAPKPPAPKTKPKK